jgi:hypothetical protein
VFELNALDLSPSVVDVVRVNTTPLTAKAPEFSKALPADPVSSSKFRVTKLAEQSLEPRIAKKRGSLPE